MKVTITGSSGFVGGNLTEYLRCRKVQVLGLSLRSSDWDRKLDLSSDAVVHLAGKVHDTKNTLTDSEYITANRDLTIRLFDKFLQSDIRDFIFFSTVKAVADRVDGVLKENIEANPQTSYGKSKWLAEQYIQSQVLKEGKRVFIIRPCMIHGPGNKGNLNLLYKLVSKGIPWPLTSFENQRSFLSIENLQYVIYKLLNNSSVPGGVYNLSDDEFISTNHLIILISEVLKMKPRFWKIPSYFIIKTAKIGDVLHLPLNSERLQKLTESYMVSNQKIKTALGINQLPLSGEEGLKRTLEVFKQVKNDTIF